MAIFSSQTKYDDLDSYILILLGAYIVVFHFSLFIFHFSFLLS
jgi:hypothetical protein